MLFYNLLAGLAVAASTVNAYSYVTVASTTTTISGTPTATATPTPTSLSRSTSACVGWGCGSTSCLPATTKIVYSVCNEKCLGRSTTTSTFTTRPPPVTATVPCGIKYKNRALYVEDEPGLEKRWTCAPGPTSTTATTLPCPSCLLYPHTTVVTTSIVSTNTVYATCPPSTSTPSRTSTSTPPPTSVPTWSAYCFWLCTNSTTRTTIYNSASITTAGWDFCAQACT